MDTLLEAIHTSTNQATVMPMATRGLESIARQILQSPIGSQQQPDDTLADLTDAELRQIADQGLRLLRHRSVVCSPINPTLAPVNSPLLPSTPDSTPIPKVDIYDNARFEQIACAGLTAKYDGSPEQLIPTLNLIHL
jgi:hypothetical protein